MTELVHIADPPCSEGVDVVVAYCSAVGLILSDGKLTPEDFDFVGGDFPENATCAECRTAFLAKERLRSALRLRKVRP